MVAGRLARPAAAATPAGAEWISARLTVAPGESASLPRILGEKAVFEWSARVLGTRESRVWADPARAHNAYRFLVLEILCDGEGSIETPLGDFFGSGPGVNPYENLFFTVDGTGSGGHISLNRWYVFDALPYRRSIRFDQEIWQWMPFHGHPGGPLLGRAQPLRLVGLRPP